MFISFYLFFIKIIIFSAVQQLKHFQIIQFKALLMIMFALRSSVSDLDCLLKNW